MVSRELFEIVIVLVLDSHGSFSVRFSTSSFLPLIVTKGSTLDFSVHVAERRQFELLVERFEGGVISGRFFSPSLTVPLHFGVGAVFPSPWRRPPQRIGAFPSSLLSSMFPLVPTSDLIVTPPFSLMPSCPIIFSSAKMFLPL